ncbi:MAG: hypothetical protein L3J43_11455 [Sulfurovum sp.]|nr:hypothetical protein [Sulfurovum sp.]
MNFFSKKYWKEQLDINIQKYTLFSILISSLVIVPFLHNILETKELLILIFTLTVLIQSIFDWIFDLPNYLIGDNKITYRIISLIMAICIFYMFFIGYLYKHYPFLENLIGATWVIEHFNF